MIDVVTEAVAGRLAERAVTRLGPALIFWSGGALAWLTGNGGWAGLVRLGEQAAELPGLVQLALLAGVLVVVSASALLVTRLTRPVLRLLEGYWPRPAGRLRDRLVARVAVRRAALAAELRQLAGPVDSGQASASQTARYAHCEAALHRLPAERWLLPTPVGNLLRAAEVGPTEKYGVDAVAVWPHLWCVLPEPVRTDLARARVGVDNAVAAVIWGLGFVAFAGWNAWAVPAGLLLAGCAAGWWVPARAASYADLLAASYDLYRGELYRQLRWPLPDNPDDERRSGRQLTTYLVRGLAGTAPTFVPAPPPTDTSAGAT